MSRAPTSGAHHIHVGTDKNGFIVLDATSGDVVWSRMEPLAICTDSGKHRPCEVYSTALVLPRPRPPGWSQKIRVQGSEDGTVRAFDAATGEHTCIWNKTVGAEVNGSPVANPLNAS